MSKANGRPYRPRWRSTKLGGLRPGLSKDQVTDLGLAHLANVDAIANGAATPEILWQTTGGAYTWMNAALMMGRGNQARFAEALKTTKAMVMVCSDVANRYRSTGEIKFTQDEYKVAREAVEWMDALAEVVDRDTAIVAAEIGERHCNRVMQQMEAA